MKSIKILQDDNGANNSNKGIEIAVAESLKNRNVVFVFNGYLTESFHKFNMTLKKHGINNYMSSNLTIIFDKLVVYEHKPLRSWINRNIQAPVDLLIIDTLNIATKKYRTATKLDPCIKNLSFLSNTLDCDLLLLMTGNIPLIEDTFSNYNQ